MPRWRWHDGQARLWSRLAIRARDALLAAISVLTPHASAFTVIGAQAVRERTNPNLDVPATSTADADFAVTPELLATTPQVGALLRAAGYVPKNPDRPGIWMLADDPASIDLLVPEAVAGKRGRAARLPHDQGKKVIGRAAGIEMAMIDRDELEIESLGGQRDAARAYVAGPPALLCAKAYKLMERIQARNVGGRDRVKAKDAADMWLLIASTSGAEVRRKFDEIEAHAVIGPPARAGRAYIAELFGPQGQGIRMVDESFNGQVSSEDVAETVDNWMRRFRQSL